MNERLLSILICPYDRQKVSLSDNWLICPDGHRFPVVNDIPVMLVDDVNGTSATHPGYSQTLELVQSYQGSESYESQPDGSSSQPGAIDPFVQSIIAATNGYLYASMINKLTGYLIPDIPFAPEPGKSLLDIGCGWGRWSISAARKGYKVVGVDPWLEMVLAAKRVANQLGLDISYVVADAKHLPFVDHSFDYAYSCGVFHHFNKEHVRQSLAEVAKVLRPGGLSMIQLTHKWGLRSLYNQLRNYRSQNPFRVRYWNLRECRATFEDVIGPAALSVDSFFGITIQTDPNIVRLMPRRLQLVVHANTLLTNGASYKENSARLSLKA